MFSTGTGRKRRRDLWTHSHYIDVEKKTLCLILVEGKECGHEVAGKKHNKPEETHRSSPQIHRVKLTKSLVVVVYKRNIKPTAVTFQQ